MKNKQCKEVINKLDKLDVSNASEEILSWVLENVDQYIDNQKKIFKMDIIIDEESEVMPTVKVLQELYRALPDDPEIDVTDEEAKNIKYADHLSKRDNKLIDDIIESKAILNKVVESIYEGMKGHPILEHIFEKMVFYYEMKGINQGELLIEKLSGEVDILKFEYEDFNVNVKIKSKDVINSKGEVKEKGEVTKDYDISSGFVLWLEIAFKTIAMPQLF